MSADDALLIFLDEHTDIEGWLHLRDGRVVARGPGLEGLPPAAEPDDGEAIRQVAVVPGDTVTLHWLEVPAGLAPLQAAAAAKLMAAEASAQPVTDMHVAVGPDVDGRAERAVALVPALAMAGWLGSLQSHGIDPDLMLPEPLLLPLPDHGFVRYDRGDKPLFRGAVDAFSIEPELADVIVAGAPIEKLEPEEYEAGLAAAIADPALNLRQGPFAKRHRWQIDWRAVRRMAWLALAILLATLAIQLVLILRYTYGADAIETEARQVAASAAPGAGEAADPRARLNQRLAELRGGGAGYGAIASALFTAINATPSVELSALSYDSDGSLHATFASDSSATLAIVRQRIEAAGFNATLGTPRVENGRQVADMTARAR